MRRLKLRLKTPLSGFLFGFLFSLLLSVPDSAFAVSGRLYSNEDGPLAIDLVKEAKKSLDLEIYTLTDPTMIREITRAANRGVKVRIVKDPSPVGGEDCEWFPKVNISKETTNDLGRLVENSSVDCSGIDRMITTVKRKGGKIVPFDKSTQCGSLKEEKGPDPTEVSGCFQHGKIMILDRTKAWLSTGNLDATNLCLPNESPKRCNREFSWEIVDRPVVASLLKVFEHDFKNSRSDLGKKVASGEIDARVTVSPFARDPLIDFIDSAKKSIQLQNQYLKDEEMNEALVRAARRGVRVEVQIASFCSFGKPSENDRSRVEETYGEFDDAGIESRTFSSSITVGGKPGYLHAKYIVVDGKRGWLGSTNGSRTAFDRNREFGVFFENSQAVSLLKKQFRRDFEDDGSQTWEESLECTKDFVEESN